MTLVVSQCFLLSHDIRLEMHKNRFFKPLESQQEYARVGDAHED